MSLLKCPDCGKMISHLATFCIGCGRPIKNIGVFLQEKEPDIRTDSCEVSLKRSDTSNIYTISRNTKLFYLLGFILYISIYCILIYTVLVDKRIEYNYLIYISVFVTIYVTWMFISTAYKIEIEKDYLRFIRILGSVDVPFESIDSIQNGGVDNS
jgi:hypothetical protein